MAAFYAKGAPGSPMDQACWQKWMRAHQEAYFGKPLDMMNDPDFKERQRLSEEYQKRQDPKILEKITAPRRAPGEEGAIGRRSGSGRARPPHPAHPGRRRSRAETARFILLETREERVARLVAVYRDDAVNQTIVQLAWDNRYVPPFGAGQAF